MKVACLQMRSTTDIDQNTRVFEDLVRQAAAGGARYIQSPEMTGILQRNPKRLFEAIDGAQQNPLFTAASALASELDVWIHVGSTAVSARTSSDGLRKARNRAGLFSPAGHCQVIYDKIHMFDVDLDNGESWRESKVYEPGDKSIVTEVDGIRFGISICYDLRFPNLYRDQAQSGAGVLTCPASFTRQTGQAHWHTLLKARAVENGAFVIAAAQGGTHEDGRQTYGHSLVVNPWGEVVAELDHDDPGVLVAEIDLSEVELARKKIPNLANGREYEMQIVCGPDHNEEAA